MPLFSLWRSSSQSSVLHHAGFFEKITPVNFTTFTMPHVRLPRYPSLISALSSTLGFANGRAVLLRRQVVSERTTFTRCNGGSW